MSFGSKMVGGISDRSVDNLFSPDLVMDVDNNLLANMSVPSTFSDNISSPLIPSSTIGMENMLNSTCSSVGDSVSNDLHSFFADAVDHHGGDTLYSASVLSSPINPALSENKKYSSRSLEPSNIVSRPVPPADTSDEQKGNHIFTKSRIQDLINEIDPNERINDDAQELLLGLIDNFVDSTLNACCTLAKHRNGNMVEVKDVQLYLDKVWGMWIPGFGNHETSALKKSSIAEAHKQRLSLLKKSVKK